MLTLCAHARLHFGLLNLRKKEPAPIPRRFGGVGLMIERPDLRLHIEPTSAWSASGFLAERALSLAQRFAHRVQQEEGIAELPPRRLQIERAMPEHAGLGAGTQLGLAVARALAVSWGLRCDLSTLARRVGRGLRSAVGAHGFEQGGLLVEAGKRGKEGLAPLIARLPFPESWRVVLILPEEQRPDAAWHGEREREAFAQLAAQESQVDNTEGLCRLLLLGLLPAVAEGDAEGFGDALYEFNVRVGETFAAVQGGTYASPRIAELIAYVRGQGVHGAGQSSWGPTVFAIVADEDRAVALSAQLRQHFSLSEAAVVVTQACNRGASIETLD